MTTILASTQAPIIKNYIRGDSRLISIAIFQSDGVTPFNLTGCEVFFTVNANTNNTADTDTSAIIALKNTSITNPTLGIATIQISNTNTQDVAPGTYYYDVQLKDANGNITSLAQNQFIIIPDVTRSIS
jgi:hypothetical protein